MQKQKKQQLKTLKHLLKHNQIFSKSKELRCTRMSCNAVFLGTLGMSVVCQRKMK